ncbi:hypothetical protein GCM10010261_51840 [Streptomyces pilosus]|uniref:Uncharacterized protein n=1 Tax=Streptomyces pilosus TaxID=28893 RepID=A0A918F1D6_9ACTN|nr:hypothetical protein GCM10010280_52730 [Streptomyces pilosus]GGV62348.1 hypothetical protein GCM10010261_51840 [Streptomyces pilosus]
MLPGPAGPPPRASALAPRVLPHREWHEPGDGMRHRPRRTRQPTASPTSRNGTVPAAVEEVFGRVLDGFDPGD